MKCNGKTHSMEKEKSEENERTTCLWMLPECCIAEILALTSPRDVCRLSLVSTSLRSAADSDSVWAKFLPSDYLSVIAKSPTPIPDFRSLKDVYVYLSHNPLLIDEGRKIFSLEKWTGKKCYFLSARDLNILWSDTPEYWEWISVPESRFPEVAQLKFVWWLHIWGTIRAGILSARTSYTAYFVYKLKDDSYGFDTRYMEVSAGISGVESKNNPQVIPYIDYTRVGLRFSQPDPYDDEVDWYHLPSNMELDGWFELELGDFFTENEDDYIESRMEVGLPQPDPIEIHHHPSIMELDKPVPKLRDDGWFELELGDFFTENEDDYIELRMEDLKIGRTIRDLIVEGIEIRPTIA